MASTGDALPFTEEFCVTFSVLPSARPEGSLTVYVSAGSDLSILDYMRYRTQAGVRPQWIDPEALAAMTRERFLTDNGRAGRSEMSEEENGAGGSEAVRTIDSLIRQCVDLGASDIHIEPGEQKLRFRARVDGVLVDKRLLPRESAPEILSRIKIMARLDIAEKRRPQDGRIRFAHQGRVIDIRVSVIPTDFGEKAVLRLLDKDTLRLDLASLGFAADQHRIFLRHVEAPHGIVLVTGPTGSGKTTTLYAALNHLCSPEINISTVEDPIEYNLEGINQTQVRPEIGLDFAAMLRSLLRQDPDIIMVGEIRDRETLEIAMRASMTGHLVLSTLHTNSAVATVARLLDMGAEPFLLASSVRLIVAQRLLRRICRKCFQPVWTDEEDAAAIAIGAVRTDTSGSGGGCSCCAGTGFRGRVAIYEILEATDTIKEALLARASEPELARLAQEQKFKSMKEQAHRLVAEGITTPSEALREIIL